jgi:hypothetical protein
MIPQFKEKLRRDPRVFKFKKKTMEKNLNFLLNF